MTTTRSDLLYIFDFIDIYPYSHHNKIVHILFMLNKKEK